MENWTVPLPCLSSQRCWRRWGQSSELGMRWLQLSTAYTLYTGVDGNVRGEIKLEISTALATHCYEELSFCYELLEAVIAGICHENIPLTIHCYSTRLSKLSLTKTMCAKGSYPLSTGNKHTHNTLTQCPLHSMPITLSHHHLPPLADGYSPWSIHSSKCSYWSTKLLHWWLHCYICWRDSPWCVDTLLWCVAGDSLDGGLIWYWLCPILSMLHLHIVWISVHTSHRLESCLLRLKRLNQLLWKKLLVSQVCSCKGLIK